jgi:hypothetical protein
MYGDRGPDVSRLKGRVGGGGNERKERLEKLTILGGGIEDRRLLGLIFKKGKRKERGEGKWSRCRVQVLRHR